MLGRMPAFRDDSIRFANGRRSIHVEQFIRTEQRAGIGAPHGEIALAFRQIVKFGTIVGEEFRGVRAFSIGRFALEAEAMCNGDARVFGF